MVPFKNVFIDIVGGCNAKCPYCNTGARVRGATAYMRVNTFGQVLDRLLSGGLIDARSVIGIFNWGEPLLHPDLNGIVGCVNTRNLEWNLSTNASIVPPIAPDWVKRLSSVRFSMSGFSQSSYDRIHKLRFEGVVANITEMVRKLREVGYSGSIEIAYHVYQFNTHEVAACSEFARQLGVVFHPYYAIMNDWKTLWGWLEGSLSAEEYRQISEDLFCNNIRPSMQASPSGYVCPQLQQLVLDEKGNVVICCQVPKDQPEYLCGNILTDSASTILELRAQAAVCRKCTGSGMAYYLNTSLVRPPFVSLAHHGRIVRLAQRVESLVWKIRQAVRRGL